MPAPTAHQPQAPEGFVAEVWRTLTASWDDAPLLVSVVAGPEHRLVYANAAVEKLFGARPYGLPLVETFPGMNVAALEYFDQVLETGRTVEVPVRRVAIRDLSGGDVVMRYVLTPLSLPDGQVIGVVSHALDVTAETRLTLTAERVHLLAKISEAMNATERPGEALQALCAGMVPLIGDVAAVFVVPGDVAARSDGPVALTISRELQPLGLPPVAAPDPEPSPYLAELASGVAMVLPVNEQALPQLAPDPRMREWLVAAGITSLAVLPLLVAGEMIGAVVVATAGARRPYDGSDLPFLQDVAARAGAAITHVRSVRRSHQVALDLQRAMLPPITPAYRDREVAGRYLAGVADVEVGGDFWDVVDIGGGQMSLGVGDVSGRGVPAAVVMGQARAAMRATSFAQLDPLDVLSVLDEQLAELVLPKPRESSPAPPRFITALYGVFEPRTASLRFACAGHLPPIIRLPDGRTHIADVRPGTPLGLQMGGWTEVSVDFPAGSTVAMFTDGLVESRVQEVDDGLRDLARAVQEHGVADDLDDVAGALIRAMGRDQAHLDDVALLLMRTSEAAYPRGTMDLPICELAELAGARQAGRDLLRELDVPDETVLDTVHVLDELVANAVEHAHGPADLHLHVTGVRVVIEVTDQGVARPRPRLASGSDERGRGLAVTAGMSSRWGVRTGPRGKTVWAEILLPEPSRGRKTRRPAPRPPS